MNGNIIIKELIQAFYRIRDKIGYENYIKEWFCFPDEELTTLNLIYLDRRLS
ncbi:hypothetical protein AN1V17_16480 [Vallitalea sediminicola]